MAAADEVKLSLTDYNQTMTLLDGNTMAGMPYYRDWKRRR